MNQANPQSARRAAEKIIDEFEVRSAPVPIEKIVKAMGITLQYAPLADDLSGMAYVKDGLKIIGVNALHHPNRQRFTIAHELAHHVLHASEITGAVHVDKSFRVLHRDQLAAQGTEPLEIEANAFASQLLMPEQFVQSAVGDAGLDLDDDQAIEGIAKRFKVSTSVVRNRLSVNW